MVTPALAQQQSNPDFVAKALAAVQQQRNTAHDMQASAEAREALLKDEIVKLKAQIEELKKKLAENPAEEKR